MGFINRIKTICWERAIKPYSASGNRDRNTFNLDTAQHVGVIYNASEEHMIKEADEFFTYLKGRDIKHTSIGYAKYPIVPHYCIPQLTKHFICKKDLNFCWIPRKSKIKLFTDEQYDLLISLDIEQNKTLQFIAAITKAKFKAGYYDEANLPFFDFLLKSDRAEIKEYIKQLIHYLSVFNTKPL